MKMWYIYILEYYLTLKEMEFTGKCMDLEMIIL